MRSSRVTAWVLDYEPFGLSCVQQTTVCTDEYRRRELEPDRLGRKFQGSGQVNRVISPKGVLLRKLGCAPQNAS
jgi:hypothetical protein